MTTTPPYRPRVLIDGTPLLGTRTGIGRYTASLAEQLGQRSDLRVRAVAFTMRGWRTLRSVVPDGVAARGLPVPARALRACWLRAPAPPIELLAGPADVVHATNFVLPPSLRAAGVVTVHDLAFLDDPAELGTLERDLPDLVRRSVRRASIVCVPTRAVGQVVTERLGTPEERVRVTPLGVGPEWFEARPLEAQRRADLGLPEHYLLFVGSDGPRKGLPTLLKAHEHAADLPPLVLAGPGVAGAHDRVVKTGYLDDDTLRSVVAGARALVLPSRDEGFGLPVVEAMACGVPVVCSDVAALREISGGLALQVPVDDMDGLIDALRSVLADNPTSAAGDRRRAHARTFTWQRCAETTARAYRDAIDLRQVLGSSAGTHR